METFHWKDFEKLITLNFSLQIVFAMCLTETCFKCVFVLGESSSSAPKPTTSSMADDNVWCKKLADVSSYGMHAGWTKAFHSDKGS